MIDSIKATEATVMLKELFMQDAIYSHWQRCWLAFFLSTYLHLGAHLSICSWLGLAQ